MKRHPLCLYQAALFVTDAELYFLKGFCGRPRGNHEIVSLASKLTWLDSTRLNVHIGVPDVKNQQFVGPT